mgnify:CR=1 FL=1
MDERKAVLDHGVQDAAQSGALEGAREDAQLHRQPRPGSSSTGVPPAAADAATRAATDSATDDPIARFLCGLTVNWYRMHNGGNMWSGWVSYLSFFRHVAKLKIDYSKFAHYEAMAAFGPRFMHEKFWIVSDRPNEIHRDEQNRPHRVGGPHIAWRDGTEIYTLHGIRVSKRAAMGELSAKEISEEPNAEVRRVLVAQYNAGDTGRYVRDLGAKIIHEDKDRLGHPRRLMRIEQEGDEPIMAIEVTNSTPEPDGHHKLYTFRCHPELRPLPVGPRHGKGYGNPQPLMCHNAIASTYGYRGEDFALEVET